MSSVLRRLNIEGDQTPEVSEALIRLVKEMPDTLQEPLTRYVFNEPVQVGAEYTYRRIFAESFLLAAKVLKDSELQEAVRTVREVKDNG